MNPLRLHASNFRSYDTIDLELPLGATVVVGPNGAGKSTLVEAIRVALFGRLADHVTAGEDESVLQLDFEHGGHEYRVRRRVSRGKSSLDLERYDPGDVYTPLTRETQAATQAELERLLRLSEATYAASTHLTQGQAGLFTEARPADRKQILAEILGLSVWDDLLSQARADLRSEEHLRAALEARATALAEQASMRPVVESERDAAADRAQRLDAEIGIAEGRLDRARTERAKADAALAERAAAEARLAAREQTLAQLTEVERRAQEAAGQIPRVEEEIENLAELEAGAPALQAEVETLRTAAAERDRADAQREQLARETRAAQAAADEAYERARQLNEQAIALFERAERLTHDEHKGEACDRCGTVLDGDARQRAIDSYDAEGKTAASASVAERARGDELRERAKALAAERDTLTVPAIDVERLRNASAQLGQARRAAVGLAGLHERLHALRQQAAEAETEHHRALLEQARTDHRDALDALADTGTPDVARLDHDLRETGLLRDQLRDQLNRARENTGRLDERLAAITRAEQELLDVDGQSKLAADRLGLLRLAARAYHRDGVPALIVENAAIPQIEREANRILGELADGVRVELRTLREKRDGGLADTLDVVIVTGDGARPYETFSGGERTRLNLALRIGLARLLAHRRGAESRILCVDEPEFLDEQGAARLADVLRGLTADFDRVILVSHLPALASSFDRALVVSKDGDRSRVEPTAAAAASEAVAAGEAPERVGL